MKPNDHSLKKKITLGKKPTSSDLFFSQEIADALYDLSVLGVLPGKYLWK